MPTVDEIIASTIDEKADSDEQAERMKSLFMKAMPSFMPTTSPLAQQPAVNMFDLTVALITAAFCVGKDPGTVRPGNVRPHAVGIARSLFTDDGRFLQNQPKG